MKIGTSLKIKTSSECSRTISGREMGMKPEWAGSKVQITGNFLSKVMFVQTLLEISLSPFMGLSSDWNEVGQLFLSYEAQEKIRPLSRFGNWEQKERTSGEAFARRVKNVIFIIFFWLAGRNEQWWMRVWWLFKIKMDLGEESPSVDLVRFANSFLHDGRLHAGIV